MNQHNNKNYITISVVMAVYNAEKHLEQCLSSILRQTKRDIEIICVDDDSKDSSLNILKSFAGADERVQVYHHANCGAGASRNWGATFAKGKYIIFLDADDFFEPNFLQLMYEEAEQHQNDITICNYYSYDDITGKEYELTSAIPKASCGKCFSGGDIAGDVFEYQAFRGSAWNKLYRREFIMQIGDYFLESRKCDGCEDLFFTLLASLLSKRVSVVPLPLVHYRENINASLTSKKKSELKETPYWTLLFIYRELIKRNLYQALQTFYTSFTVKHLYDYLNNEQMTLENRKEFYKKLKEEWWPNCGINEDTMQKSLNSETFERLIYDKIKRYTFEEYIQISNKYNEYRKNNIETLIKKLNGRNIVIWGKGEQGYRIKNELQNAGINDTNISFVDVNSNDKNEQITKLIGKKGKIYALVSMDKYYPQVVDFLLKQGYEEDKDFWYVNKRKNER